jgi:hypothetical protein
MSKESKSAFIEITIILVTVPAFFALAAWCLVSSW